MSQYRTWIRIGIVAAVIVVVAGALVASRWLLSRQSDTNTPDSAARQNLPKPTREEVPVGTVVPEPTSTGLPADVAQPQDVKRSGNESSPYLRTFKVTVANGAVSPANIVAYAGDILTLTFESKDQAYAFAQPDLGLAWQVPAGGFKTFQFQAAAPGKYIYYCPSCGGPDRGPVGYIVAAPK
ncbi:MAG: hypothetical protein A2855_00070 [Candidatus Liptonbacteria bacterium RIFCSPHIGHO2_01_FULL_57_28]|uniref:EfeO-type cupredoxin-like domain-containing protein n=1 Tax=Candidatus Liptonbacteria bacterium RIFCSPHIGHO2_01_FULL_57_28 TaxID=1798647 RepID=A0A1G2CAP7_9BACT|nr:MAG: hypothetical protein A2855_00070 [Candidatus Liptonbacteria bacterium RIFCSPHIGHO2_01_FULL_57_28]